MSKEDAEFAARQFELLQLRLDKQISIIDQLRLEGMALAESGMDSYAKYLRRATSARRAHIDVVVDRKKAK